MTLAAHAYATPVEIAYSYAVAGAPSASERIDATRTERENEDELTPPELALARDNEPIEASLKPAPENSHVPALLWLYAIGGCAGLGFVAFRPGEPLFLEKDGNRDVDDRDAVDGEDHRDGSGKTSGGDLL